MSTLALRELDEAAVSVALNAVAQVFGFTTGQILGHRRHRPLCEARHALFAILRDETDGTTVGIGKRLNRDHGTIIHGANRAETLAEIDPRYAAKCAAARAVWQSTQAPPAPVIPGPARPHRWPWL